MAGTDANLEIAAASITVGSDLGYIKEGVKIAPAIDLYTIEGIEGRLTSPMARRTKESYSISTILLETTQANLVIAWDITNSPAAGVVDVGGDSFKPTESNVIVYGVVPGGSDFVRTWDFGVCVVSVPGEHHITQFAEAAFPVTFVTLWDGSNSRLFELTDAAA